MDTKFATAMSRALEQTRAGNAGEATRIIQAAMGNTTAAPAPEVRPRRPLGQVIDSLVNGKPRAPHALRSRTAKQPQVPEGARYERHQHQSPHGSRPYTLYVPSPRADAIRGVVLMLHGCTQNADDFATGTAMNAHAERENIIVVYAEQTRGANNLGCWNWFRTQDQMHGQGEPAILASMVQSVAAEHGLPQGAAFVAGLSAGGAMAAIVGKAYPDVFSAVGVHSGLAPGAAQDVQSAYAAMGGRGTPAGATTDAPVPTIVFHGSADTTVNPVNAAQVLSSALAGTGAVEIEDGAHRTEYRNRSGQLIAERWHITGLAHAWSGGSPDGSYTDPNGPDASAEMLRFFLAVQGANQ